jgi:hypothetical protein
MTDKTIKEDEAAGVRDAFSFKLTKGFEQGDVVYLKSGSPPLTVVSANALVVSVSRIDPDGLKVTDTYPTAALARDNNAEWLKNFK